MHKVSNLFYLIWEKATLDSIHILLLAKDIWSVVIWGKYTRHPEFYACLLVVDTDKKWENKREDRWFVELCWLSKWLLDTVILASAPLWKLWWQCRGNPLVLKRTLKDEGQHRAPAVCERHLYGDSSWNLTPAFALVIGMWPRSSCNESVFKEFK